MLSAIELAASRWNRTAHCPTTEVFVVGDMMNCNNLPGVAEVALQSGLHAAHVIRNRVRNGAEPTPWKSTGTSGAWPRWTVAAPFSARTG